MDEKKVVSFEELRQKLEHLKILDRKLQVFGADKHKYVSYPVTDEELERLEDKLGVRLPEDYRNFLRLIGFGAGPYYGLASPDEILAEISDCNEMCEGRLPVPSQPFPFTHKQAEECWRLMGKRRPASFSTAFPTDGCIPICFEGCSFWIHTVTAGELAGSMWFHSEDIELDEENNTFIDFWKMAPDPPSILDLPELFYDPKTLMPIMEPLSPLPTFVEWYHAWINRCLLNFEGPK